MTKKKSSDIDSELKLAIEKQAVEIATYNLLNKSGVSDLAEEIKTNIAKKVSE